jgi:tetratricopeptide (TPR) repeat protein
VVVDEPEGEVRYRLLETVRHYAGERLREAGEVAAVRARHRDWVLALAEQAEPELRRPDQRMWLQRLETEHANLRAALERCGSEGGGAETEARLASALVWFWIKRGYLSEGRQCLEAALSRDADLPPSLRIRMLDGAGQVIQLTFRDPAAAARYSQACLDLARETGDLEGMALALSRLALQAAFAQDTGPATVLAEESLVRARETGDPWLIAHCMEVLGVAVRGHGDVERATVLFHESLALKRQVGDKWSMVFGLLNAGGVAQARGDTEAARRAYQEGLALSHELEDRRGIAKCHECLEEIAAAQNQPRRAAQLMGAAEGLLDAIGASWPPNYVAARERARAVIRAALGEEALAAAWTEGRGMALDEAVRYALEEPGAPGGTHSD